MKKAIFLLAALATIVTGNAQQDNKNNSMLWKIEGNGIEKPSYLFGTIHMLCASDFEIKEKVSKAFNSTSNLVLEVNTTDPNEIQAMQKMMKSETTLSSRLDDAGKKEANDILTSQIGITLDQAEHVSPSGLLSIAIVGAMKCPPTEMKFYEGEFTAMAQEQHKTIGGLETIDSQAGVIEKSYSLTEILSQIKMKSEYGQVLADMARFHKEENLPELYKTLKDKRFMDANAENLMLTERNKAWVKKIPAIVKKESTFFAVGAGHLYGKTGLIELLRQQGYKVTPVK
ncbi:TraB/GumN family protein [Flavobacterium hauense]